MRERRIAEIPDDGNDPGSVKRIAVNLKDPFQTLPGGRRVVRPNQTIETLDFG